LNRKILFVDDTPEILEGLRLLFEEEYEVHTAEEAGSALTLCATQGPFAVVVSDQEMPGLSGVEFLNKLHRGWPDTTRIMMTAAGNYDLAIEALHEGEVFRFIGKPAKPVELIAAVEDGLKRFRQIEQERLVTEQLQFTRESLLTLTETLERRLADQMARLQGLEEFTSRLGDAQSLAAIADLTAETVGRLLGGRATRVRLRQSLVTDALVDAEWGTGSFAQVHEERMHAGTDEIGSVVLDQHPGELAGGDRRMLESIASSAAVAAHNQIRRRERDELQHATIYALAALAEHRDNETGLHLERVSEYCRMIAEGLRDSGHFTDRITDTFVDDLVRSAPLHDIGKVGIPDSILLKPGKLTAEEWEVMRTHPTIGAETLRHILETSGEQSFLRMGHEIAQSHHERWDGGGYPEGISGDRIPLAARILALADVYDALTTRRPYKEPWTHAEAGALLQEESGKQFDPRVVAAFEQRAADFDRVRASLADPADPADGDAGEHSSAAGAA
jgi:response regulator RpfG family c-di-GMP phosphodiesterase